MHCRRSFARFLLFALTLALGACQSYDPMPEAIAALASDEAVTVEEVPVDWAPADTYWAFHPTAAAPVTGFIFYPGAYVDARSYAPPIRALAEAGFFGAIVNMPNEFPLAGNDRADEIIALHPDISHWVIGGHSLGGTAASAFAHHNAPLLDGVVHWASYTNRNWRLDDTDLEIVSIYGTNDGLSDPATVLGNAEFIPEDTTFVEIVGGNHTQFGWYGDGVMPQDGDLPATISREVQQDQIVAATRALLDSLAP